MMTRVLAKGLTLLARKVLKVGHGCDLFTSSARARSDEAVWWMCGMPSSDSLGINAFLTRLAV